MDGKKIYESSVEEEINNNIENEFNCDRSKFSGGGKYFV